MKIAIKGHIIRGKEIIQILESLGGINACNYSGNNFGAYYELHGNSIVCMSTKSDNIKYYTLEEFEKEFPFKVGDKVIHKEYDSPFEIIEFNPENVYPYTIDGLCKFSTKSCALTKYQPKMKEERNITLTLDKAKEWYKKGGELKEVALQAYSEEELTKVKLPKTWEEFCKLSNPINSWRYNVPIKYGAAYKLELLRDCWRQGNIPQESKYKIKKVRNKYIIVHGLEDNFLSFCDLQTTEDFLECFRDLIEKAGDLI